MKSRVALVRGEDRYGNVAQALNLLADEINLRDKRSLLIKVNFVSVRRQLAATHVDGVRAVLDFLRGRYEGKVTLAAGPASNSPAREGFKNFGYLPLAEEYGVEFVDLNRDEAVRVRCFDRQLQPKILEVAQRVVESDYRIAIGPPKTHESTIVTLSLKNIAVGSLIGHHKGAFHQGYPAMNLNLYALAKVLAPHLSIIDGYQGMEGNGPVSGDPVELRLAIASTDFLAADTIGALVMGFDPEKIGYLTFSRLGGLGKGSLEEIELLGNTTLEECTVHFRPHPDYERELAWQIADPESFL